MATIIPVHLRKEREEEKKRVRRHKEDGRDMTSTYFPPRLMFERAKLLAKEREAQRVDPCLLHRQVEWEMEKKKKMKKKNVQN